MIQIESELDFNKEIENLIENANFLKKVNDKFKNKKIHGQQLRVFLEDIEQNTFKLFNYTLKLDGKPLKTKMVKKRGSYNVNKDYDDENSIKPNNELTKMLNIQEQKIRKEIINKVKISSKKYTVKNINEILENIVDKKIFNCDNNENTILDILILLSKKSGDELLKLIEDEEKNILT